MLFLARYSMFKKVGPWNQDQVVKPVVKRVWQLGKCLYTRYNRLSVRFDNQLYRVYKHSTGCQTRLTTDCIVYTAGCQACCRTSFGNQLHEQWLFVQHGCQIGCTTRFDNVWQLVERTAVPWTQLSNWVWQPVERTVAVRSSRLNEQWLFVQHGCQTGCTTGLTTGCIV